MAVQKSRVTPSRRGQRRSHDALSAKQLSTDPTTGEVHLRHHITADGFYRGKKVIQTKSSAVRKTDVPEGRCPLGSGLRLLSRARR